MTPTTSTVYQQIMPLLLAINDASRAANPNVYGIRTHAERFGDACRLDWEIDGTPRVTHAENEALRAAYWAVVRLVEERVRMPAAECA